MDPPNSRPPHTHNSTSSSLYKPNLPIPASILKHKTCPICLSQITGHRPAIITNCMHVYCLHCLLRWSDIKRTCPLCKSPFHSYFSSSSLSSPSFRLHRLLPLPHPDPPRPIPSRPIPSPPVPVQRVLRRTRAEINAANRRSRPVPRRRSFGRAEGVPSEVVRERVLQWRASIYKLGLRAAPFSERNLANMSMKTRSSQREAILQRVEPWIHRELQALLQDPDPIVIVHVATSVYMSSVEKVDMADVELAPLRPFLHEWTDIFWHELRCFAESSFTMDTYDEVVEYSNSDSG